jgi:SAM-dependent methyltransferase
MSPTLSPAEIRAVNERYHDAAADEYDGKWGIDFGPTGQGQVLGKLRKALGGGEVPVFDRGLEIGAGTGYFTLNLMLAGVLREAVCTDISPGMLGTLQANAEELGLEVQTIAGDAERLEVPDESFDLVFGHAVLHHLPDLERAFAGFHRALRPGGTLAFAGEPSRYGDRLAAVPKRGARALAPLWRRAMRAGPAMPNGHGTPDHHGHRTLESTAEPADVPWLWRQYAYRGYLALQQFDRRLLEGRLPPEAFYNLMLAARRPG